MSSNRSHKQRPEDVTLPPISQIFNVPASNSNSHLSLPPLRAGHESTQARPPSNRSYGPAYAPAGVPDLQDPRMTRSRYDQNVHGGSSAQSSSLPANRRPSSQNVGSVPYGHGHHSTSSSASRHMSSGMVVPEHSMMRQAMPDNNRGSSGPHPGYGPSPYSYAPAPSASPRQYPSSHAPPRGSSHGPGGPPSGSSRAHDHPGRMMLGEGSHAEEHGSARATKYECSYCGKGFLRPSALKIHIISHTGDKDFVCPEESCGRRFGVRSNMLRHIRLVHQNNQSHSSGEELSRDEWSE